MSRHLYGPVPSRRLGRSLGADVVPFKTCTYDCIYRPAPRSAPMTGVSDADIRALLRRRARTAEGVAEGLGLHVTELLKRLQALIGQGSVVCLRKDNLLSFTAGAAAAHRRSRASGAPGGHARRA